MRPKLDVPPAAAKKFIGLADRYLHKDREKQKRKPRGTPFGKGNNANPNGRKGKNGGGGLAKALTILETRRKYLAEHGVTPLEFLLSVVHDPTAHMDYRLEAARSAMPYVHRKMPIAIEGGDPTKPIVFEASALTMLQPAEKMLLLALVEKMAVGFQVPKGRKPWEKVIEGVAHNEAESDDAESTNEKVEANGD